MAEIDQYKCPQGEEGQEVIKKMNEHHRDLTIWGLSNIPSRSAKQILDVGCGGGMTLKFMSVKFPSAKCMGIDISEECVKASTEYNKMRVQWGTMDVLKASVESIPEPERMFDIVTAVETYFFWPDLRSNIAHIVSRMNNGGVLCIVSEQYPTDANREKLAKDCITYGMKLVENDEMKEIMESCGLSVNIVLDADKNWVTFIGTKN
ncbi:MAG: class I SAM-dependent methyltransferase [archaeon]|nr:class I SAM-dependent methyltransferase [archaeon]